jgi:hypothetical protein
MIIDWYIYEPNQRKKGEEEVSTPAKGRIAAS